MKRIMMLVLAMVFMAVVAQAQTLEMFQCRAMVRCSAGFLNVLRDGKCECEKKYGACPICGAKGDELGLITIADADPYFANWAWIPSMVLYACPKCHSLFWENSKKEE